MRLLCGDLNSPCLVFWPSLILVLAPSPVLLPQRRPPLCGDGSFDLGSGAKQRKSKIKLLMARECLATLGTGTQLEFCKNMGAMLVKTICILQFLLKLN